MKVNLFLATVNYHPMGGVEGITKGEKLATVELEVVPSGQYVIDGVTYTLADKPIFHIKKPASYGASRNGPIFTHNLEEVDLLCIKQG